MRLLSAQMMQRISAQVSARRRHPAAFFVVLLLGLGIVGGVYAAVAPAPSAVASTAEEDLIEEGRKLYLVGCASCHGQNAEGVITRRGNQYGPPLIGVGAAAVDFQVSTGRMPATSTGVQVPEKPPVYSDDEVEKLAAYIASLGPGPPIPTEEQYSPIGLSTEEIVRGGELWRTNCTACHNFAGQGGALPDGKYAPGLEGVDPIYMYEAMLTGPQQMPVFSEGVLLPADKRAIIGYLKALEEQPDEGGWDLGSLGPVTEGLAGWVVGMGVLVLVTVWIGAKGVRAQK